jgi:glycosyltransferase involved in cell wall biosynthesis
MGRLKIAEIWGATQTEVESSDEYWLKGEDTYHTLSSRRVARGHQNLVCLMTDQGRRSAWLDGVQYEFFLIDASFSHQYGSRSEAMLGFLRAWQPDILLLHAANRIQTLFCLQERFPGTHYILDSNSAAITGIVLDEIARNPECVSACMFKAGSIRDRFCQHTGYPKERTRVFPSGIDLKQFQAIPVEKDLDCLWVGYLRENNFRKKNVAMLMDVFANLSSRLFLVGTGNMAAKLQEIAPANVTFLGYRERRKLPHILIRCKIFLHPSLFDPCPRSVSEALACGLPVIGLKEGLGTEEQILDAVNGYRVETSAEMQDAIQRLLADERLRQQMGYESRKIAETRFNVDNIERALEAFLQEVVNS